MNLAPRKPTCFDCRNAEIDNGYPATREDPGEEPSAFCRVPFAAFGGEEFFEPMKGAAEEDAHTCPFYVPESDEKCGNCGVVTPSMPLWSWPWQVAGEYDTNLTCSVTCRDELQAKLTRQRLELEAALDNIREEQESSWVDHEEGEL